MITTGDCVEVMATMDAASMDAIVTDPPYGLEFMGKEWDRLAHLSRNPNNAASLKAERTAGGEFGKRIGVQYGTPTRIPRCRKCGKQKFNHPKSRCQCSEPDWDMEGWHHNYGMQTWHERWATEALRIAKPGAYLLSFGGTRTYHRMACAIEDAGWIIRDCLVWAYASGFPKSRALLKPAWEPIVMARKPGPLRDLAIDACRIGEGGPTYVQPRPTTDRDGASWSKGEHVPFHYGENGGRWPANLILTDPIFDGDTPGVVGGGWQSGGGNPAWRSAEALDGSYHGNFGGGDTGLTPTDTEGTYSRFFLIPKADRAEREPVLPSGLEARSVGTYQPTQKRCPVCGEDWIVGGWPKCGHGQREFVPAPNVPRENVHPTVKPLDLMRHLVRLVTPTGGTVLDPFLGSGTTAIAAEMEGFAWLGIEREPEYVAIAEARLNGTQKGLGLPA